MARVLIVGGCGYVGGSFTDLALLRGHEVRVYDSLLYEDTFLKSVNFIYGDIRDETLLKKQLKWAEVVVWLAAIVGDAACTVNPKLTYQINVDSINFLVSNFNGRIIFPSTCSVYGAQTNLLNEVSPTKPLSLYAETKLIAEEILMKSSANVVIFRLGTLFGLSDQFARLRVDLVLNAMTIRAVKEKVISIFGGNQFRPLLHVKDVAMVGVNQLTSENTGIYNLHYRNTTILGLAETISNLIKNVKLETQDMNIIDSRNYQVSSQKAIDELSFLPKISLEEGILEIKNLIVQGRIKNVENPRFNNYQKLIVSA